MRVTWAFLVLLLRPSLHRRCHHHRPDVLLLYTARENGVIYDPLQSTAMQMRDKLSRGAIVLFPRAATAETSRLRGRFCPPAASPDRQTRARFLRQGGLSIPLPPLLLLSLSLFVSPCYIPMRYLNDAWAAVSRVHMHGAACTSEESAHVCANTRETRSVSIAPPPIPPSSSTT